jgi:hypothetical protein
MLADGYIRDRQLQYPWREIEDIGGVNQRELVGIQLFGFRLFGKISGEKPPAGHFTLDRPFGIEIDVILLAKGNGDAFQIHIMLEKEMNTQGKCILSWIRRKSTSSRIIDAYSNTG